MSGVLNGGLNGGLSLVLIGGLSYGWEIGLPVGLLVILFMGGLAWWQHWVLRFLLWRSGATPWRLVPLLDEAAQRILLRKVGGGYRFIHDLFRDYLATLEPSMLSGMMVQGALQIDTAHREETTSPPAPSRKTGFTQENRIAALLKVVMLLLALVIALAGGQNFFSEVQHTIQNANHASATVTAQVEANRTAEALALVNASPVAYPPHNQSPILTDPLQDNSQGNNWEEDTNEGNCKFIHRAFDVNTHRLEWCPARAWDFTNFITES